MALNHSDETAFPRWRRSVTVIAIGAFMASFAMSFWMPFLPLYMKDVGAESDARALAWVSIAFTGIGISRLVGGPVWGVISDRYGRKKMFLRALFAATITTLIAAFARNPWHLVVALTFQGGLSGFIPAAIALTSVSVPRQRLTNALGTVQGAQYVGNTLGPAIGAFLAEFFGIRGAVVAGAVLPAIGGLIVAFAVPADVVGRRVPVLTPSEGKQRSGWVTAVTGGMSLQLALGLAGYFVVHMSGQLLRTSTPIALEGIAGGGSVTRTAGWIFSAAGLASAVGAAGMPRLPRRLLGLRPGLIGVLSVYAGACLLLGQAHTFLLFGIAYTFTGLCQGAMLPGTNTVIAAAVPYERRGAAFGLASSVQALAFVAGPLGAAYFATVSLGLAFSILGVMMAAVALLYLATLREPVQQEPADASSAPRPGDAVARTEQARA